MHLSPGVRPLQCGIVVREKRSVYYRYSKVCRVCHTTFVARNATAKTCSLACRVQFHRIKQRAADAARKSAAAERAAAAKCKKKRSQKVSTKR